MGASLLALAKSIYYCCKHCFQFTHYVTSYMQHTGKKESKKEI